MFPRFEDIPYELLVKVLQHAEPKTKATAAEVNHAWSTASSESWGRRDYFVIKPQWQGPKALNIPHRLPKADTPTEWFALCRELHMNLQDKKWDQAQYYSNFMRAPEHPQAFLRAESCRQPGQTRSWIKEIPNFHRALINTYRSGEAKAATELWKIGKILEKALRAGDLVMVQRCLRTQDGRFVFPLMSVIEWTELLERYPHLLPAVAPFTQYIALEGTQENSHGDLFLAIIQRCSTSLAQKILRSAQPNHKVKSAEALNFLYNLRRSEEARYGLGRTLRIPVDEKSEEDAFLENFTAESIAHMVLEGSAELSRNDRRKAFCGVLKALCEQERHFELLTQLLKLEPWPKSLLTEALHFICWHSRSLAQIHLPCLRLVETYAGTTLKATDWL